MPRFRGRSDHHQTYRPGYSARFRILKFLYIYKPRVERGHSWPTANFIRINLFSHEENWNTETRGTLATQPVTGLGAPLRTDRFVSELEVCIAEGWVERISDAATGYQRYRITEKGVNEYDGWVNKLCDHLRM
ncbi:MAG: hypothetical protein ABSB53_04585 [Nitrososphaerales archaeon]|jgi:hypothetical protein